MIESEGLALGILFIPWGGIFIALGIACGALLTIYEAKRRGDDPEIVYYLFLPLIIWGTLGARFWHILTPPLSSSQVGLTASYYLSHPFDLLAFWVGGYGIPGAWMGVAAAMWYIATRDEMPFWELADLFAPAFALAQAIGRISDYFNQQIYGLPTTLPWGIFIEAARRLPGFEAQEYYHPLFAYESILNFANAAFLLWLARRVDQPQKPGNLFLTYILFYSAARFFLEFLRLDVALVNGININQAFFLITAVFSAARLYWLRRAETVRSL